MAVNTYYGTKGRGLREAVPPSLAFSRFYKGQMSALFDKSAFIDTDSIGSKIYAGELPSHAVILPISRFIFGAFGAGVTLNLGDANAAAGVASAVDVSAAGSSALLEAMSAPNACRELWEHLGYARDPERMLDLYFSTAAAAVSTATATLTWEIYFQVR